MDLKLHSLPPMKRFTLLHHEPRPKLDSNSIPPSHLPTKKRKQPDNIPLNNNTPYSLPAKKRVWAPPPESNPLSTIDLNVEYVPSPEKKFCFPCSPHRLPAKKRAWAVPPETPSPENKKLPPNSPRCLPAKKRAWVPSPDRLPARKRVWASPEKKIFPPNPAQFLPGKKRVWAVPPESPSPGKKIFPPNSPCRLPAKKRVLATRPESPPPPPEKEEEEEDDDNNDGVLCAVCSSTDADPTDPIVFCDGCDLMVHTSCYGNPLIKSVPEGDWLCQKCEFKHDNNNDDDDDDDDNNKSNCCLCPVTGGALKRTKDDRWAHIGCAVLVPEVFFEDSEGRDGVDLSLVPGRRWKGRCYLCGSRKGCVVECSEPRCTMSFHVGCGLEEELCIELIEKTRTTTKSTKKGSQCSGVVAAFCRKHTDIWDKQQQTGKFKIVARDEE
ncbi:hypothetical protein vseg_011157 [Gypsophila vaccaria]